MAILSQSIVPSAVRQEILIQPSDPLFCSRLSAKLEQALFEEFGQKRGSTTDDNDDVGPKYRMHFRALTNLLRDEDNATLYNRLVTGDMKPRAFIKTATAVVDTQRADYPAIFEMSEAVRAENIRTGGLKEEFTLTRNAENNSNNNSHEKHALFDNDKHIITIGGNHNRASANGTKKETSGGVAMRSSNPAAQSAAAGFIVAAAPDGPLPTSLPASSTYDTLAAFPATIKIDKVCDFSGTAEHLSIGNGSNADRVNFIPQFWSQLFPGNLIVVSGGVARTAAGKYLKVIGKTQAVGSFVFQVPQEAHMRAEYNRLFEHLARHDKYAALTISPAMPLHDDGSSQQSGSSGPSKPTAGYLATLSEGEDIPDYFWLGSGDASQNKLQAILRENKHALVGLVVI